MTAAAIDMKERHIEDTTQEHEDHVLPVMIYVRVFGALLVLTYLTVQVSYLPLGSLSLPVAMLVALVKAGLVIGFFMHLRYDVRFNALVFFGSALFVTIFFSLTMIDLLSRGALVPETETEALEHEQSRAAAAAAASAPTPAPPAAESGQEGTPTEGGSHKPIGGKDWFFAPTGFFGLSLPVN